jgi:hypothetical protein
MQTSLETCLQRLGDSEVVDLEPPTGRDKGMGEREEREREREKKKSTRASSTAESVYPSSLYPSSPLYVQNGLNTMQKS